MVVRGDGVAENLIEPVGRAGFQPFKILVLRILVSGHRSVLPVAGAHHADDSDDRICLAPPKALRRELVPEFLLPINLLRRIHQSRISLRTEGDGHISRIVHVHRAVGAAFRRDDNDSVRCT